MIHQLKIEHNYLRRLVDKKKKAELRINDRDYQLGDILEFRNVLWETKPGDKDFWLHFKITHIHSGLGLRENFVMLSLEKIELEAL